MQSDRIFRSDDQRCMHKYTNRQCATSTCLPPAGGTEPLFGTNPISFAWPRPRKSSIVVDMATVAMAQGEVQLAASSGHAVPARTGLDARGQSSTDPREILQGVSLPLSGHKGSAMALMVELLAVDATGEWFSY